MEIVLIWYRDGNKTVVSVQPKLNFVCKKSENEKVRSTVSLACRVSYRVDVDVLNIENIEECGLTQLDRVDSIPERSARIEKKCICVALPPPPCHCAHIYACTVSSTNLCKNYCRYSQLVVRLHQLTDVIIG